MTVVAHSDDVVAHKGRFCARREYRAELDACPNWIEVCRDFWSIFGDRDFFLSSIGRSAASAGAAGRSSERGKVSAGSRGLKKYTQKRNEGTFDALSGAVSDLSDGKFGLGVSSAFATTHRRCG